MSNALHSSPITEHVTRSGEHLQFHLACGPEDGPLLVFVHGWPDLSWGWRHQLRAFAALGFRAVAPDLRGYGRSRHYPRHDDYGQRLVVADLLALLQALGRERAVWIGHDWGAPTVWSIASHHPERCAGVAGLCVPYRTIECGFDLQAIAPLLDRALYPADEFPYGQFEYVRFYEEAFERVTASMEADVGRTVRALFRAGDSAKLGTRAHTSAVRRAGGWFGGAGVAPETPRDERVIDAYDESVYTAALARSGFFGPGSYYMNHEANAAYAREAVHHGRLAMPALFVHARWDTICETLRSPLAQPMREFCSDLSEATVDAGHWLLQEKPREVNAAIARWLVERLPAYWPQALAAKGSNDVVPG